MFKDDEGGLWNSAGDYCVVRISLLHVGDRDDDVGAYHGLVLVRDTNPEIFHRVGTFRHACQSWSTDHEQSCFDSFMDLRRGLSASSESTHISTRIRNPRCHAARACHERHRYRHGTLHQHEHEPEDNFLDVKDFFNYTWVSRAWGKQFLKTAVVVNDPFS